MKKIIRMLVFSAGAIYLTSLWNRGFIVNLDFTTIVKASLLVALMFYLVRPLSKLVLLPLNILTLGVISTVVYCFLFFFLTRYFGLINIKEWTFEGIKLLGFAVGKIQFSQTANVFVSAISVSTIINSLEHLI